MRSCRGRNIVRIPQSKVGALPKQGVSKPLVAPTLRFEVTAVGAGVAKRRAKLHVPSRREKVPRSEGCPFQLRGPRGNLDRAFPRHRAWSLLQFAHPKETLTPPRPRIYYCRQEHLQRIKSAIFYGVMPSYSRASKNANPCRYSVDFGFMQQTTARSGRMRSVRCAPPPRPIPSQRD